MPNKLSTVSIIIATPNARVNAEKPSLFRKSVIIIRELSSTANSTELNLPLCWNFVYHGVRIVVVNIIPTKPTFTF